MGKRYHYYQPNEKDLKDTYGDCTIRALTKALGVSWLEAYDKIVPYCREYQASNIFDTPIKVRAEIMDKLGFDYTGVSVRDGKKRPTVDSFARDHKTGVYILNVAGHVVAVAEGQYWDTWNSGCKSVYGYFTRR